MKLIIHIGYLFIQKVIFVKVQHTKFLTPISEYSLVVCEFDYRKIFFIKNEITTEHTKHDSNLF